MEVVAIASVAASLIGGGVQFMGAMQARRGAAIERQQYEEQKKATELAMLQDEALRQQQLNETLATQEAIRAGRGLELHSPGFKAIQERSIRATEADIVTSRLNYLSAARRSELGMQGADVRAENALYGGIGGLLAAGASAGRQAYNLVPNAPDEDFWARALKAGKR